MKSVKLDIYLLTKVSVFFHRTTRITEGFFICYYMKQCMPKTVSDIGIADF